jgi:hypothetical protein
MIVTKDLHNIVILSMSRSSDKFDVSVFGFGVNSTIL